MFFLIVDAHAHIGGPPPEIEPDNFVSFMVECGIDKAVVCRYVEAESIWDGNEVVGLAVKKYPEKLIGFFWVKPEDERIRQDIKIAIDEWGFMGLKVHLETHETTIDRLKLIYNEAHRFKIPIYIHIGEDYKSLDKLCQNFKEVNVILGHLGTGVYRLDLKRLEKSLRLGEKHDNLYLETSGNTYPFVRKAVEVLGPEKIVFGTDLPHTHPLVEMRMIELLKLSKKEENLIFAENICKILNI